MGQVAGIITNCLGLLERFDTNRDGTLDLNEWEAARLEARRFAFRSWMHLIFFSAQARLHIYFLSEHASA